MPLIKKGGVATRSIEDLDKLLNTVPGQSPNYKTVFKGLINSIDDPSIKQQVIDHLYEYLTNIHRSRDSISILTIIHHTNTYIQNLTGRNSLPTRRPASSSRSSASSSRSSTSSNRSSVRNNNARPASSSRSSASSNRSSARNNNARPASSNRSSTRNNNNH